ncbi:MAG: hypothetical protein ABSC50_11800 [Candidatus Bathyarchaeia archaeon]
MLARIASRNLIMIIVNFLSQIYLEVIYMSSLIVHLPRGWRIRGMIESCAINLFEYWW